MVSAGLDTVPGNLVMGIAYLASEDGQRIQQKAYDEIMTVYPNGDAWEKCLVEEKVPYVSALVRETLRFWTVIPICLPRESTKDIEYNGATIPAGTTFFMVSLHPTRSRRVIANQTRTPGPPTTTKTTSRCRRSSFPSAIWMWVRVRAHRTMAMALGRACVPAPIWPTASSSRLTSG